MTPSWWYCQKCAFRFPSENGWGLGDCPDCGPTSWAPQTPAATARLDAQTRTFPTGARRDADNGKPRLDYLPWRALRSLGAYMRESAERFGACNYRRGMPLSELNASMLRHAADYQTAHSQDEAARALHGVLFNASVALEQILLGRDDLDDMDVIRDGARPNAEYVHTWKSGEPVHSVRVVTPRNDLIIDATKESL